MGLFDSAGIVFQFRLETLQLFDLSEVYLRVDFRFTISGYTRLDLRSKIFDLGFDI